MARPAAMRDAVVYRCYSADGDLLYIGMTLHTPSRIMSHIGRQPWGRDISTITIKHYESRKDAASAEADAIRVEAPLWNSLVIYKHSNSHWSRLRQVERRST